MNKARLCFGVAAAIAASAVPSLAWAQSGPPDTSGGGSAGGGAGGGGGTVSPGGGVTVGPTVTPGSYVPTPGAGAGWGNPQSSNGTIGGGNATESSAHPVTGEQEDSFDLGRSGGGSGAAHGDESSPIFIGGSSFGGEAPYSHIVRKGDTLWYICDYYFRNPYQWPRIWSYNPQIKNPHWIYPGDEVKLHGTGEGPSPLATTPGLGGGGSLVDRRRQQPNGTVFLRDSGWVRDSQQDTWGTVSGASEDKMFLTDFDHIYLSASGDHKVQIGDELTIYKQRNSATAGQIVQVLGTARVDQWDPHEKVARAQITETLDVIERGASVMPACKPNESISTSACIARQFQAVRPARNDVDVQAHVLASVHPNEFYGQNQVVFIDAGETAGLKPGNRLFVIRRGDAWRRSLVTPGAGYRVSPDDERPMPKMEKTPGSRADEEHYPDEVVGELRVVAIRKETSACMVTGSKVEIEVNDLAVARKGY
jgi:hypothetical protein